MAVEHRYGRFQWRESPQAGWEVFGPDGVKVAWVQKLSDASKYAIWAESLLQHYLDKKLGVFAPTAARP